MDNSKKQNKKSRKTQKSSRKDLKKRSGGSNLDHGLDILRSADSKKARQRKSYEKKGDADFEFWV